MFTNNKNIKFNEFQNMCRTCMLNFNLKPIQQNNVIIEVLEQITGLNYEKPDELPQQICETCIKKLHDIHMFVLQCKSIDTILKQRLNENKNETVTVTVTDQQNQTFEFVAVENVPKETNYFNENTTTSKINNQKTSYNILSDVKRPYGCDVCTQRYATLTHLIFHKRSHNGVRPFKCDTCNKTFANSSHLRAHKRIHTGEKPFKCSICEKSFTQSGALNIHKMVHTDKRPFKCQICKKGFKDSYTLMRHQVIHNKIKPLQCITCAKTFTESSYFEQHLITHQ